MENKEIFAQRLVELREKRNITQQTLADDLKITRQSLSLYEKAERTVNIDLLVKIAKYFDVSADYLLGFSNASTTDTDIQFVCNYTGLSEFAVRDIMQMLSDEEKNILSDIIEDSSLLNIIWGLYHLEELKKDDPTIKRDEQLKARLGAFHISEADIRRYYVLQQMETILNRYDYRCKQKEASDNGKHNPKKE